MALCIYTYIYMLIALDIYVDIYMLIYIYVDIYRIWQALQHLQPQWVRWQGQWPVGWLCKPKVRLGLGLARTQIADYSKYYMRHMLPHQVLHEAYVASSAS